MWLLVGVPPTPVEIPDPRTRTFSALETSLRHAVDRGSIGVVYQPIVAADDARIVGFEALARWNDPERGPIAPDVFIPLAEATGEIGRMGRSILERACQQLRRMIDLVDHDLFACVNVSARQLLDPNFTRHVELALAEADLEAHRLVLEMTESAFVAGAGPAARQLRALAERNVRLAIDDFGTGYSALGYLKRLPVGLIKIDRSFVGGIVDDAADQGITRAILAVANELGLEVIAEGVETEAQATLLRTLGCDYLQGHLFSVPLDGDALVEMLRERLRPIPLGYEIFAG